MPVEAYNRIELMAEACRQQNADWSTIAANMTSAGLNPNDAVDIANSQLKDVISVNPNSGGGARVWYYPRETIQTWDNSLANLASDSNKVQVYKADVQVPISTSVDPQTGKTTFSTQPKSGMFTQDATYILANVSQAITAASVGITLGKAIDSYLYDANPAYWDSIGLSSMDPDTWSDLMGNNGLFDFIFGLDSNTGDAQAYMDAEIFAYMAQALSQNGWFSDAGMSFPEQITTGTVRITSMGKASDTFYEFLNRSVLAYTFNSTVKSALDTFLNAHNNERVIITVRSATGAFSGWSPIEIGVQSPVKVVGNNVNLGVNATINPLFQTYGKITSSNPSKCSITDSRISNSNYTLTAIDNIQGIGVDGNDIVCSNINVTEIPSVDGVTDQTDATLPSINGWTSPADTLTSLQSQYPDLFSDAIVYDTVQPDGSVVTKTYIPVAMPSISNNSQAQPISDIASSSQAQTKVNQDNSNQTLIDYLLKLLQDPQTATQTQTDTIIPPLNPIDTGTGDSPVPTIPTGEATALWSVYHPTQAQINSFGAWLWGSPFTTNINKLFQNPIDGVISLHKIFVTPIDSGNATIVVGTLDSNVSSATVTQQYVYVDCGSISLNEDFVNVFDYPPYTQISLYLPFIGIVPLDVNDVMRSSISIRYGVDVFTGACLAMVKVDRDGHTVNMYQYAGMCAVNYPLGNLQHSQMVSGILAVAGGVASMVASGGVSAPAALTVAAGAASASKSVVGRSGGFSGNAGAMGIKIPYLIIQRPQTRVADTFPQLAGYPTNRSGKLGSFSGQVNVTYVHVENIPATDTELLEIENLLKSGILI